MGEKLSKDVVSRDSSLRLIPLGLWTLNWTTERVCPEASELAFCTLAPVSAWL